MLTRGINAAFHDCSACIVRDGIVLAAAGGERLTRVKHGKRLLDAQAKAPFIADKAAWGRP